MPPLRPVAAGSARVKPTHATQTLREVAEKIGAGHLPDTYTTLAERLEDLTRGRPGACQAARRPEVAVE
jgi:hypothetical protein